MVNMKKIDAALLRRYSRALLALGLLGVMSAPGAMAAPAEDPIDAVIQEKGLATDDEKDVAAPSTPTQENANDVPDVVDPDDALKALIEGEAPSDTTEHKTLETVNTPAPTENAKPTVEKDGVETVPVAPEGKATEAPKAESKADVKAEVKAEKTEAKPKVEKDYGEDNPNPEAKAAAMWSAQVVEKTQPKMPPELGAIPAFLGITPYQTTKADIEARFKENAFYSDDAPLGPRHVVTGDDFGLGAQTLLIGYTVDRIVSDLYLQIPADKVKYAEIELKGLTAKMDPEGLWTKVRQDLVWRAPAAELELSRDPEGGVTILYGAVARQAWETRQWLDADPNARYPRFSGLLIGHTMLPELQTWAASRSDCRLGTPAIYPNGSFALTLTGACFGLPHEVRSDLWFDADSHRLVRLIVNTKASAEELEPVEAALAKRYKATSEIGAYQTGESPARNVWMPRVRIAPAEGRLEFDVPIDGITSVKTNWEALQAAEAARKAEAKRIDQLFD